MLPPHGVWVTEATRYLPYAPFLGSAHAARGHGHIILCCSWKAIVDRPVLFDTNKELR